MSNSIHLIGNVATVITRNDYPRPDGEVLTKVRFLLATDKDKPSRTDGTRRPADYIPVEVWGPTARAMAEYKGRGSKLAITGRLKAEFWRPEGAEKDVLSITVVADRVEFLGPPRRDEENGNNGTAEVTPEPAELSSGRAFGGRSPSVMPLRANGSDTSPTVASLRLASGTLRTALARLGQEPGLVDRGQLVTDARAHLGAALHLVDGVGRALKEELNTRSEQGALREGRGALVAVRGEGQR